MILNNAKVIVAMITPFNEKNEVDYDVLPELVEYLLANGNDGLLLAGTTGESPTLSHDEKLELYKAVVKIVDGRVPLIANVGSNNTAESVAFAKEVAKIDGIHAGLAVVPYYNKPNQEGLYQHFKAISEASDLPIMLYNVPGRTITSLSVETILRLAKLTNIFAIKECAGLEQISQLVEQAPEDFYVYTGEDSLAFAAKSIGGQGVISVASHHLGKEISSMYDFLERGNLTSAAGISRKLLPKMDILFSVPSPAPVKAVFKAQGINVGSPRLPLIDATKEEAKRILSVMNK